MFVTLGRMLGLGVVGGAAYGAGYANKQADVLGDWKDGISSTGKEVAEGFGAMMASARNGFQSQARMAPPPGPTITHVYHDRGSERSTVMTILLVGGAGVTGYWIVCWYKGWDFFGMSHSRTQELITMFQTKFQNYADQAKAEMSKLRDQLTKSQESQDRQEGLLNKVDEAVKQSGVHLEEVNLKSDDIAQALQRNAVTQEAQTRGMMAIQYTLAAIASGGVENRDQAMYMLQQSFKEQLASLPSNQLAEAERKRLENGTTRPDATGTSSSIVSAIQKGSQLVAAPIRSIAGYLWSTPTAASSGSQSPTAPLLTSNGASTSAAMTMPASMDGPEASIRGFGPGGRISRRPALEDVSGTPRGFATAPPLSFGSPKPAEAVRDHEEEEINVEVKRPVFF